MIHRNQYSNISYLVYTQYTTHTKHKHSTYKINRQKPGDINKRRDKLIHMILSLINLI